MEALNLHESPGPAVRLPDGAVIVDLRPIFASPGARFAAAAEAAVDTAALRSFVWLCGDEELTALDWQHPAYKNSPARHELSDAEWSIPVFPNGDYHGHMTADPRRGTFGPSYFSWSTRPECEKAVYARELSVDLSAFCCETVPRASSSAAAAAAVSAAAVAALAAAAASAAASATSWSDRRIVSVTVAPGSTSVLGAGSWESTVLPSPTNAISTWRLPNIDVAGSLLTPVTSMTDTCFGSGVGTAGSGGRSCLESPRIVGGGS